MNTTRQQVSHADASTLALDLARKISRGDMRPGERLPSERVLSAQSGLSRQSVRKAISALVNAEVVSIKAGRGAASGSFVRSNLVPIALLDPNREPPSFSEVGKILEARRLFETPVALFASIRMDERDYDDINEVLAMQRKAHDLHSFRSLDSRFHLAIAKATHNDVVYQQMVNLMRELEIARHVVPVDSSEQEIENTLDMHSQTLEAISSSDPVRIAEVMSCHLAMMEQAWERASGRKLSTHAQKVGFTIAQDV